MANPKSVTALEQLLSDTVALMIQTQGVHWNFTGGDFFEIHERSQLDYEGLFLAVDEIAERMRSIGALAPASLKKFAQRTTLADADSLNGKEMIVALARSHKAIAQSLQAALKGGGLDPGTEDLFITRLKAHEMASWMWGAVAGGDKPVQKSGVDAAPAAVEVPRSEVPKKKSKKAKGKTKAKVKVAPAKKAPAPQKVSPKPAVVAKKPAAKAAAEPKPAPTVQTAPVKVERSKSGRLIRIVKDTG